METKRKDVRKPAVQQKTTELKQPVAMGVAVRRRQGHLRTIWWDCVKKDVKSLELSQ